MTVLRRLRTWTRRRLTSWRQPVLSPEEQLRQNALRSGDMHGFR